MSRVEQEIEKKRLHVLKKALGLFFSGGLEAEMYRISSLQAAFQAPLRLRRESLLLVTNGSCIRIPYLLQYSQAGIWGTSILSLVGLPTVKSHMLPLLSMSRINRDPIIIFALQIFKGNIHVKSVVPLV